MTSVSARAVRGRPQGEHAPHPRETVSGSRSAAEADVVTSASRERAPASWAFVLAATVGFLVVALITIAHHEYWRDEVRAFSLATDTPSLAALFHELRYEAHPALWFLLLRGAHAAVPSPLVLPAVALVAGVAAVALFLRRAPFGRGEKLLFVFGLVPLYDHTVMARNYGIGMLALFVWAAAWPTRRERAWAVGLALACLANTHVPALTVAGALLGAWALDVWQRRRTAPMEAGTLIGMTIATAGIVAAVLTARPAADVGTVSAEAGGMLARAVRALPKLVNPGGYFVDLLGITRDYPGGDGPIARLLPYAAIVVLDVYLFALALGAWMQGGPLRLVMPAVIAGLTMLFAVFYRGSLRHQAVVVLLAVALEWVRRVERARGRMPDGARQRAGAALVHGALLATFVVHVGRGAWAVADDLRGERTPMPRLAAWMAAQPALARAAVVAEPGYYADALPYYTDRLLYFPRERRWGRWASWKRLADSTMTLDDLRRETHVAERISGRPVVVLIGDLDLRTRAASLEAPGVGLFTWTPEERRAWNAEMELRGVFAGASTENVLVYTRRAGVPSPP